MTILGRDICYVDKQFNQEAWRKDECVYEWMDGWMNGWMNEQMDGWVDVWMDE